MARPKKVTKAVKKVKKTLKTAKVKQAKNKYLKDSFLRIGQAYSFSLVDCPHLISGILKDVNSSELYFINTRKYKGFDCDEKQHVFGECIQPGMIVPKNTIQNAIIEMDNALL